ncbi:MAG: 2-octaprenyl-3-methyl-6-methoxy-1,4-benzoquinol hydroxylase [Paraglaciecola sp.]|jgi:2-octaprenyl-3-methyl-6-methoxy-1,4-benzoquinol hydroxylase
MVGAASALGLAKRGFSIALIEHNMPDTFDPAQPPDLRVCAISIASEGLLTQLGAWQHINAMRLCPYRRLSVWEKPNCRSDFNCADIHASHIGHIVENRLIQLGLHQALRAYPAVTWFSATKVKKIITGHAPVVELADGQTIASTYLIGADGANSQVRQAANIGSQGWQYAQQALGIQIKTTEPQQDITWQQFTPTGPVAFLPLYDGYGSLVWYNEVEKIRYLKTLSKQKLKEQIIQHFPKDLVDFEVQQVASFPINRMHANQYVKDKVVLVGDAAHSINPLAGQGVNLGFKDVAVLLEGFSQTSALDKPEVLRAYETARRRDNLIMMSAMDAIYGTFSNQHGPLRLLRNLGLKLANNSGPIKQQVLKYAMGL